jgi:hypothetical protein
MCLNTQTRDGPHLAELLDETNIYDSRVRRRGGHVVGSSSVG